MISIMNITERQTMIITIAVQKGGTGKTHTTANIGYELSKAGYKVLMIDADPQGSLTASFGIDPTHNLSEVLGTGAAGVIPIKNIIVPVGERLDLAPSAIELSLSEMALSGRLGREGVLNKALQPIAGSYDYILIDTQPSLGLLTINALTAADQIIIPIQPNADNIHSLGLFMDTLNSIKEINPRLKVMGVLLTFYNDRYQLHKQAADQLQAAGILLFQTRIGRSVRVEEAAGMGQPITAFDPDNPQAAAYRELTKEIINHGK